MNTLSHDDNNTEKDPHVADSPSRHRLHYVTCNRAKPAMIGETPPAYQEFSCDSSRFENYLVRQQSILGTCCICDGISRASQGQ